MIFRPFSFSRNGKREVVLSLFFVILCLYMVARLFVGVGCYFHNCRFRRRNPVQVHEKEGLLGRPSFLFLLWEHFLKKRSPQGKMLVHHGFKITSRRNPTTSVVGGMRFFQGIGITVSL